VIGVIVGGRDDIDDESRAGPITNSVMRTVRLIGLAYFFGERIGKIRIEQHVDFPAIAAGIRSAPATTSENAGRACLMRDVREQRVVGADGADHAIQFLPDNRHAAHHVIEFLPRRPNARLAQAAIGRERETFRRRVLQAQTHPSRDVAGVST